jgi:hypothetical protein
VRLVRSERLSRGGIVLLLALGIAAVLALRAAATGPGAEPVAGPEGDVPLHQPRSDRLHPMIVDWLARRGPTERARVIVTFQPGAAPSDPELARSYDARVLERFWINNSALVDLPVGAIAAVAARPDVGYVQPEEGGEAPPA